MTNNFLLTLSEERILSVSNQRKAALFREPMDVGLSKGAKEAANSVPGSLWSHTRSLSLESLTKQRTFLE
jgi:hypothetical protein